VGPAPIISLRVLKHRIRRRKLRAIPILKFIAPNVSKRIRRIARIRAEPGRDVLRPHLDEGNVIRIHRGIARKKKIAKAFVAFVL